MQKLTLEQELEIIRPYVPEGAEAFIDYEQDEDGAYPSHVALGYSTIQQVAEDEWEPDVEVVSLAECDLSEGGEFFRRAFFAAVAELARLKEESGA